MIFDINNLIEVIARKYEVELPEGNYYDLDDLNKLANASNEFMDDIKNIIVPLVTEEVNLETDSIEDIHMVIPEEYFDEINPIGEDGEILMSMSQLRKSMEPCLDIKSLNTNESADLERNKFRSAYIHDDYPIYSALEKSWKLLESDYKVINREDHPSDNPLSSFSYYVELGFYPPPEILMILVRAINAYYDYDGEISLDQAFFGEKYKKTGSSAFVKHKNMKYQLFEFSIIKMKKKNPDLSIEKIVEILIEDADPITMSLFRLNPDIDIESFTRGYRRWKKHFREG